MRLWLSITLISIGLAGCISTERPVIVQPAPTSTVVVPPPAPGQPATIVCPGGASRC